MWTNNREMKREMSVLFTVASIFFNLWQKITVLLKINFHGAPATGPWLELGNFIIKISELFHSGWEADVYACRKMLWKVFSVLIYTLRRKALSLNYRRVFPVSNNQLKKIFAKTSELLSEVITVNWICTMPD